MTSVFFNTNNASRVIPINAAMGACWHNHKVVGIFDKQLTVNKGIHKEFVDNANDIHRVIHSFISPVKRVMKANRGSETPAMSNWKVFAFDDLSKVFLGFGQDPIVRVPVIVHIENKFFILRDLYEQRDFERQRHIDILA